MDPFILEPHVVVFCNMWWQCGSAEWKVEVSPVSCDKQTQVEWLHPLPWVLPSKTDQCSEQEKEVAEAWYPCVYCPWGGGAQQEDLERHWEADWILTHWRARGVSLWIFEVLPKAWAFFIQRLGGTCTTHSTLSQCKLWKKAGSCTIWATCWSSQVQG